MFSTIRNCTIRKRRTDTSSIASASTASTMADGPWKIKPKATMGAKPWDDLVVRVPTLTKPKP